MSQYNQSRRKAFPASAALASVANNQFLRVKLLAGALVLAGATDRDLGTLTTAVFVAGDFASVDLRTSQGTVQYIAAAAITQGADVFTAANGQVTGQYAPGAIYKGTALEAATAAGDLIEVLGPASANAGGPAGVTFATVAGAPASNISLTTLQVTDSNGNAIAGTFNFEIWLSDSPAGAGYSATVATGAVAAGASGTVFGVLTAKEVLSVQSDATGKFILSITDTAKTHFYIAAKVPGTSAIAVSAQLTTANYG